MAISELKQKLLIYELAKVGFRDAQYRPASDRVHIQPDNDRMPKISNNGSISYGTEYGNLAVNTLRPLVDRVNEAAAAWDKSSKMPFEDLKQFRVLAEYNGIMMAARDDTDYGRGLHFVTWQYNYDRTGLDHGHYTDNYDAVKEDFAVRSGLMSELKLFTPEQAAGIKAAIEYRLNNDEDITYSTENDLNSISARLRAAYPNKDADNENSHEAVIHRNTQSEAIKTAETIFGDVQSGDWVIAAGNSDYGYLLGTVTAIDKLGTPEHVTENETDDIHVDFTAFDYPPERIVEIEEDFSEAYGEKMTYEELPLDDVIMAPKELIRISHLSFDEITRIGNLRENCETFCNCFISPSQHHGVKFDELVNRLDKNLLDYHKILEGFGQGELIEMVGRIDVMNEAHHYLTLCHDFSADELDFYLQFENPLEIVADELTERRNFSDDLDFSMEHLKSRTFMKYWKRRRKPLQQKTKQQQQRLSANVRQAKENRAGARKTVSNTKSKQSQQKPSGAKSGGFFASMAARLFGRADKPTTAQQSIPYREMYRDGICRVNDRLYTKTIMFGDINYHLVQNEDKTHIFESYCDFLNYFDSSLGVQISAVNQYGNAEEFLKSIDIPLRGDDTDSLCVELAEFIRSQQSKGNNGLVKTKYVTFGIEAENLKAAKLRTERVEADILNNYKTLGVPSKPLSGLERLELLHGMFHPDGNEKLRFNWKDIPRTGLSTKDYIAPTSFDFRDGKMFRMGDHYGAVSYLQILAPELTDRMLADFLDLDTAVTVTIHIKSIDQSEAIKTIKRKLSDLDKMKIEEQKKAVRSGYDMLRPDRV